MMSSHTPAPWEAMGGTYVKASDQLGIRLFGMGSFPEVSDAEIEADARLIAAAPEMLAALETAQRVLRSKEFRRWEGQAALMVIRGQGSPYQGEQCIDAIEAAIAKARGEAA